MSDTFIILSYHFAYLSLCI